MSVYPLSTSLLRRRVVRSPEKRGARDSPRHARALPRTDEEVTPTPSPRVVGCGREPKITLAAVPGWKVCGGLHEGAEGGVLNSHGGLDFDIAYPLGCKGSAPTALFRL